MGYGQVHLGEVDVHAKFGQLRLSSLGIRGWFVFCAEVLGRFYIHKTVRYTLMREPQIGKIPKLDQKLPKVTLIYT